MRRCLVGHFHFILFTFCFDFFIFLSHSLLLMRPHETLMFFVAGLFKSSPTSVPPPKLLKCQAAQKHIIQIQNNYFKKLLKIQIQIRAHISCHRHIEVVFFRYLKTHGGISLSPVNAAVTIGHLLDIYYNNSIFSTNTNASHNTSPLNTC